MKNQPLSATYVISGSTCYVYDPQKDQRKVCTKRLWQTEVMYTCTQCRKRGSISKRLCKHDMEYEHACGERLASTRALDEAREQLQRAEVQYQEEKSRMQQEITELYDL